MPIILPFLSHPVPSFSYLLRHLELVLHLLCICSPSRDVSVIRAVVPPHSTPTHQCMQQKAEHWERLQEAPGGWNPEVAVKAADALAAAWPCCGP